MTAAVRDNEGQVGTAISALGGTTSINVDYNRWDKLYPYALILAEAIPSTGSDATTSYKEVARFTLPIPPDQLQITSPYAIQTTKTLGAIVEEHNGVPFKMIMANGTTGVNPLRGNVTTNASAPFGLFGGSISAVSQLQSNVANFTGAPQIGRQLSTDDEQAIKGTGYGQFRLLGLFLDSYVKAKKNGSRNMRLIFATFKDETAYVVTPVAFNVTREAGKALKYRYNLQLRAWKQVPSSIFTSVGVSSVDTAAYQSDYNKLLTKIVAAQTVITSAVSVINAFRADVQQILNVVRQVALSVKLTVGATIAVIDLPGQIIKDVQSTFVQSWDLIKDSISNQDGLLSRLGLVSANDQHALIASRSYKPGQSGIFPSNQNTIDPSVLDAIFSNPNSADASALLSQISVTSLKMPMALTNKINTELARVATFSPSDYAAMRDQMMARMVSLSDTIGASDAVFDSTYQNVHTTTTRIPNLEDFNVLFVLNDLIDVLNELSVASLPPQISTLDYIAGQAAASGIAFTTPVSKYAVPFPYDYTLEELSRQYLGTPDRWLEIAALNGLREPYVDEVGFQYSLIANGSLSDIVISDNTNLRIGQPIWIQSNFSAREKRHILNINKVGAGNFILTLDGNADLSKFRVVDKAYIQAFLPDTINSQQVIYLPSDKNVPDNTKLAQIPGINAFDDLLELGGVDLLLTADNDLAVTPDGDCRLAYGLQALIQRARITLGTPQGSLIRHPSFGLPIKVGSSVADLDPNALKNACRDIFADDPAFNGVVGTSIALNGPTLNIGLSLSVTGQDLPISLTFAVKR